MIVNDHRGESMGMVMSYFLSFVEVRGLRLHNIKYVLLYHFSVF